MTRSYTETPAHETNKMHLEGDVTEAFTALFEKKRLLESGLPHAHIRPLLFILGGAQRGVYGGGCVSALREAGLGDVFDTVIGVSTGAPTAAYFLSGQPETGTSIYYEECVERPFFSITRGVVGEPIADVPYLTQVFRGEVGAKAIDQNAIKASRTKLYVIATHYATGKSEFFNAKTASPDIVAALADSMSIPLVAPIRRHGGEAFVDGDTANPFPIERVLHVFDPTHILILPNTTEVDACGQLSLKYTARIGLMKLFLPHKLSMKIKHHREMFACSLRLLRTKSQHNDVHWVIAWPDDTVAKLTQSSDALKDAAFRSRAFLLQALGHYARSPAL